MTSFELGQRVRVNYDHEGRTVGAQGTVRRIRTDGGAWVALDQRVAVPGVHPFPEDDPHGRAAHVQTYPEECELLQ